MRPREWFGLGVRMLGLWFWTQAAYYAWFAFLKSPSIHIATTTNIPQQEDVAFATYYVLVGTFLFVGTRVFVWLGYGDAPKVPADADNESRE